MELRVVSGKTNGTGKPSGATPSAGLLGPKKDGYTTGERIEMRAKLHKPGPGGHFVPLGWPRGDNDWPKNGEPDYVEVGTDGAPKVAGWFHVQNGGPRAEGQVRLSSDVIACSTGSPSPRSASPARATLVRQRQALPPGSRAWQASQQRAEKAVTTVLRSAPYDIPLYELRWPIQFESKGTGQTNDVIVLVDHWSLWERV